MNASRESAIIGTLLDSDGVELPPFLSRLLEHAPESFHDLRHGEIAVAIRRLRNAGKPVHSASVGEAVDFFGATLFVSQLANAALSFDLAEIEAETVWENYRRRQMKSVLGEAQAELELNPAQADMIVDRPRSGLTSGALMEARTSWRGATCRGAGRMQTAGDF